MYLKIHPRKSFPGGTTRKQPQKILPGFEGWDPVHDVKAWRGLPCKTQGASVAMGKTFLASPIWEASWARTQGAPGKKKMKHPQKKGIQYAWESSAPNDQAASRLVSLAQVQREQQWTRSQVRILWKGASMRIAMTNEDTIPLQCSAPLVGIQWPFVLQRWPVDCWPVFVSWRILYPYPYVPLFFLGGRKSAKHRAIGFVCPCWRIGGVSGS